MNTLSMTGFANESIEKKSHRIIIEIKSVNSKYLDCSIRLPDYIKALEPNIKEIISRCVFRGKIDFNVKLDLNKKITEKSLNKIELQNLYDNQFIIKKYFPNARELSVNEILNQTQIFKIEEENFDEISQDVLNLTEKCMKNFSLSCRREGQKLKEHISSCIKEIENSVFLGLSLANKADILIKERIRNRIKDAIFDSVEENDLSSKKTTIFSINEKETTRFVELIEERIRIEASFSSSKISIAEELERMSSHIKEIKRILEEDKKIAIGKKN